MSPVSFLVAVLQVILKFFFQAIIMLSEAKEKKKSQEYLISVNPITRENVISVSKFCKIIA